MPKVAWPQSAVVVHVPPSTTNPPDWALVSRPGSSLAVMTTPSRAPRKPRREVWTATFVSRSNVTPSIHTIPLGPGLCASLSALRHGTPVIGHEPDRRYCRHAVKEPTRGTG